MIELVKRNYLFKVIAGLITTWILGALIISIIEPEQFKRLADSFWWTIVTMTTVGYGDLAPQTFGGRILAIIIMFFGIILIAVVTGTISSIFTTRRIMESKGLGKVSLKNHTLVCGWSNNIHHLLDTLTKDNHLDNIVLINEQTEDEINNLFIIN